MSSSPSLFRLLNQFDITSLGDGDADAGANVLTAMAAMLANIARQGSGIQTPSSFHPVGCSLLINGGLSTGLINDRVSTDAALCQNNLNAQLLRLFEDKLADQREDRPKFVEFPTGPPTNHATNTLFQLEQADAIRWGSPVDDWSMVVSSRPNPRIDDLTRAPKVLVTAQSPGKLASQLKGVHLDRPTLILGINKASDVTCLSDTCQAILNGVMPAAGGHNLLSGNILLMDPNHILGEIASVASSDIRWLGRLLWLVDGEPDFDNCLNTDALTDSAESNMEQRFKSAMCAAFAKRLNNHDASPVIHELDIRKVQKSWMTFLRQVEPRLPGISGTARRLLPTLAFGLMELSAAPGLKRMQELHWAGLEPLCRHLVLRMAECRSVHLGTAECTYRKQQMAKLLAHLSQDKLSARDLYRKLSITSALCLDLLHTLKRDRIVDEEDGYWRLVSPGRLPDEPHLLALAQR